MGDRILVPLDGSPLSEAVLPVVEALTRGSATEVLLLRSVGPDDDASEPESEVQARMGGYLAGVAARMKGRGPARLRWTVWHGDPAQVIVNAATREAVALVVMGTHGRDGLDRLRFGSVAETVVRRAPVPVLLVRGELARGLERPGKVLVPLDGSEHSEAILPAVERLAKPLGLTVDLLHLIESPPATALIEPLVIAPLEEAAAQQREEAHRYLDAVAARLTDKGVQARAFVRADTPVDGILAHASEGGYALIAMGTHGRSGVSRLVLGSVAERVLRAAVAPILLWKVPTTSPPGAKSAP